MAESEITQQEPWLRDFLLTWLSRVVIFFAHHETRPILPLYVASFGASSTVIGTVMAVFTITATIARLPIGLLIDRIGRKPFLLYGIVLFGLGTLGYVWAPSILLIIPFRILHGVGWSGCTTSVATLAADIAPQKRRGELIGYAAMASSLGGAIGPIVGFAMLGRFGYGGVFVSAAALLCLSLVTAWPIHEPKTTAPESLKQQSWLDAIAVRDSLLPAIVVTFVCFGLGGVLTFLPIHALKLGLENPGIWFAVYAVCLLLSRPLAGPLSDRISRRAVILPGLALHFLGILVLAIASSPTGLIVAAVISGFGFGAGQPALMTLAVDQTSPQRRGQALAQFQLFYDLGVGVGSLVLGVFLDLVHQNFSAMYLLAAAAGLGGLLVYWQRS